MKPARAARLKRLLGHPRLPLIAVVLSLLGMVPSLSTGLSADDWVHRVRMLDDANVPGFEEGWTELFTFGSGDPREDAATLEDGTFSWWLGPNYRLRFLRPLTSATHALDYALWPDSPALHHLQSVAWYALLLLVVVALYRRFFTRPWLAGLAVLLFAFDDAHGAAVGYIANRNALVSGTLALAALLAYDRWRRDGWRPGRWAGPVLFAGGLFAGEFAAGVAGYLFAHALFLERGRWWQRLRPLLPFVAVGLAWAVLYKLGGFGARGAGVYVNPIGQPAAFAAQAAQHVPVLLLAQFALPWADFWMFYPPEIARGILIMAASVLLQGVWLMWPLLRRDPAMRFWALGAILATVPVAATFPADRLLILIGVGTMAQIATLLGTRLDESLLDPTPSAPKRPGKLWHFVVPGTVFALVVIHLVLAPLLRPVRAGSMDTINQGLAIFDGAVPTDPSVRDRTVVVPAAPFDGVVSYLAFLREGRGDPRPGRVRLLSTGMAPTVVTRVDARTLRIRPGQGFLTSKTEKFLRGPGQPFAVGDTVELSDMRVTILEVDADGRPLEARFRFSEPLEAPRFLWLAFASDDFVVWTPPPVGESVTIPAPDVEAILRKHFQS